MNFVSNRRDIPVILLVCALAGCNLAPAPKTETVEAPPREERFAGFPVEKDDVETDPILAAARAQAEQLAADISQGAAASSRGGPPVRWIDARHPSQREPIVAAPVRTLIPARATLPDPVPAPEPVVVEPAVANAAAMEVPSEAPQPQQQSPARPADPKAIARVLMNQIKQSDDPALNKALNASALSVVSGDRKISESILAPLDPQQRQVVRQYHTLMLKITDQILAGDSHVDPRALAQQVSDVFGSQPITIRTVELCRRVDNFGVFEPFATRSFVAGRDQKMIVYVELDYFKSLEQDKDQFEVLLTQEMTLYNESDGLPVWRAPKETIVDRSRNRRRDFFTVKLIRLPGSLGVGKYQLKVSVEDLNGQTVAASNVPIHVVADETLASRPVR